MSRAKLSNYLQVSYNRKLTKLVSQNSEHSGSVFSKFVTPRKLEGGKYPKVQAW